MTTTNKFDVIVVGAGPAGLTAGIYLSRARMRTLILNEGTVGGQMILTHEIANYPGVENISGYQLANIMKKQAKSFGCQIISNTTITKIEVKDNIKKITLDDGITFESDALIFAPGGSSRMLNVPGENLYKGRGISYCATCDGDFFTNKEIIVVGGGNSALEEAVSLTKYASKVTVVHQFDHFQAFEHAVEEAKSHPKIEFIMNSTIAQFYGEKMLHSVDVKNVKTNKTDRMKTDGVFIFIGYVPNTTFLKGLIKLNERNEIVVDAHMATNIKGVFAAGDSTAKHYRQITTAVSDGTIAALAAACYVNELKTKNNKLVLI